MSRLLVVAGLYRRDNIDVLLRGERLTSEDGRPAWDEADPRLELSSLLRFAAEIVAWVAVPWALAAHSPVFAGVALLLLIGLPAVFVTPGDKVKVVVAVPGYVTVGLVVLQLVSAVTAAWAAWPLPVALLVWALVLATVYTELPRWRRLTGGDLVAKGPAHVVNEALAFVLELLALGAIAWWGAAAGGGLFGSLLLGIGLPLVAAVIWGVAASPKARVKLPLAGVLAVKALVFGAATLGLDGLGHRSLAILFAVVVAANTVIATLDREAAFHETAPAETP
jgi:hypothetical protein